MYNIDQTHLNEMNFKLLLECDHCPAHRPQKESEASLGYLPCVCVRDAVLRLKTRGNSTHTCARCISEAASGTQDTQSGQVLSHFSTRGSLSLQSPQLSGGNASAPPPAARAI